jgi:hypothetical protein
MMLGLVCERWTQAQRLPESDRERVLAANTFGSTLAEYDKHAEAEVILREALEKAKRAWGEDDPALIDIHVFLASALGASGKLDEAETFLRHAHAQSVRLHGPHGGTVVSVSAILATNLMGQARVLGHARAPFRNDKEIEGKLHEALAILRTSVAFHKREYGPDNFQTLTSSLLLVYVLNNLHMLDEANTVCLDVIPRMKRVLGPEHPTTQEMLRSHANCISAISLRDASV